jgi:Domain of unknown function (DUF4868)
MTLAALKTFDVDGADVTVWAVKKSAGLKGTPPIFAARWVETDARLDAALKSATAAARDGIEEVRTYDLLAQNNEGSALSIGVDETHAPLALAACADPTADRKVKSGKDLANSTFYVVKLIAGGQALLAFRKTDSSWRSRAAHLLMSVIFSDNILTLDDRPRFSLSKSVDFFVIDKHILIIDKGAFESILSYKQAHLEDFAALQQDPAFIALFSSFDELATYVGSNKIQLRRASAIKVKGYYKDRGFMGRLRAEAPALRLNILFDKAGRIQPTPDTCRDIFQALLDHRLDSRLSKNIYDVDDATKL